MTPRLRLPLLLLLLRLLLAGVISLPALAAAPPDLVSAARGQIGVTLHYDGSYQRIAYPNGDVPRDRGVCTDVVIRAYRAVGVDLQQRVHDDMRRAWKAYPATWGMKGPDRNIDHRRVPNLATFFRRHGTSLEPSAQLRDYRAGDIVTWRLPQGLPHIGIVAEARSPQGTPLVIHNIGAGTQQEDVLFAFPITGHYRYPAAR
ncbi:DUF1287 domain-containing protein [Pseudoduganella buxea]|uniref:DUF1287 domain-containing protein n=1 Tax=Pseudoduganella buxea TaxID=1949069 RepID=A0A6I3SXH4_9BURK|nr:DUF1287 domain-containing protein [Pseudoduganella buxea]MTV52377.1 DUF1287 domain-containing protein [Pseudoduganella buxea]GGC06374.1 DUF1287 domain-containing protein [Pseudoduganella buxea]